MSTGKPAIAGGCQCGQVQFRSTSQARGSTFCYCTDCRRLHGAPFAPWTNVLRDDLQWLKRDGLVEVSLSNMATRTFCKYCHAPITMVYHAVPDEVGVAMSCIDEIESDAPLEKVRRHIFVRDNPQWYEILDSGEQLEGFPDDMKAYIMV